MISRERMRIIGVFACLLFSFSTLYAQNSGFKGEILLGENELSEVSEIRIGNISGNGNKDIITVSTAEIGWFENLGNGKFGNHQVIVKSDLIINAAEIGDFNGDGITDVAWAETNERMIFIKLNDGNGNFPETINHQSDKISRRLTLSLVKGEAEEPDYILQVSEYGIGGVNRISINNDTLIFEEEFEESNVIGPVFTDDYNNDGIQDYILANENKGHNNWGALYLSQSDSNYEKIGIDNYIDGLQLSRLRIADYDGDGDVDVVASSRVLDYEETDTGFVRYFENEDNTGFKHPVILDSRKDGFSSVTNWDVNADGNTDVVAVNENGSIYWYENMGEGVFGERQMLAEPEYGSTDIAFADISGDSTEELIQFSANGFQITWLEKEEDSFNNEHLVGESTNSSVQSLAGADFDGDGLPDIAAGSASKGIYWFKNNGNLSFDGPHFIHKNLADLREIEAKDIDGDGKVDIVSLTSPELSYDSTSAFRLAWHQNLGNGEFSSAKEIDVRDTTNSPKNEAKSFSASDFNGDGETDISVTLSEEVIWYENSGDGSFTDGIVLSDTLNDTQINAAMHIGNTGTPKIGISHKAVKGYQSRPPMLLLSYFIRFYDMESENPLENPLDIEVSADHSQKPKSVAGGDFDQDGNMDIVISTWHKENDLYPGGTPQKLSWFGKSSTDTAWTETVIDEVSVVNINDVTTEDLDDDGDKDIIAIFGRDEVISGNEYTQYRYGGIQWYENRGNGEFIKHQPADSMRKNLNDVERVDLNGDSYQEIIVAVAGENKVSIYENETWTVTSIGEPNNRPRGFEVSQNYPNPFNPTTTITYKIPAYTYVQLKVFNVLGQEIQTLVDRQQSPGEHQVSFDASSLSSGIYLYQLQAGDMVLNKKMLLIK